MIRFVHYTDPLCCFSFAMQPVFDRLAHSFGEAVRVDFVMGAMVQDWQRFDDPLNAVHGPAQMAPHWYYVSQELDLDLDPSIWHDDPPDSSMPACLAVKAAGLQGERWARVYLRRAQRAVMVERRNIARDEVLVELAYELADEGFDADRFAAERRGEAARAALREDLRQTRYLEIGRFPTTTAGLADGEQQLKMVGYRPFEVLADAVEHLTGAPAD